MGATFSYRRSTLSDLVLGVILGALAASILLPAPVHAGHNLWGCWGTTSDDYNVAAWDQNNQPNADQDGIRVFHHTGSSDSCIRISSIAILGPDDGPNDRQLVEFGWVLGWDCDGTYRTTPRVFVVWDRINGGYNCEATTRGLANDSEYWMRISDGNSDTIWGLFMSRDTSDLLETRDMDFSFGTAVTNGERDCACDSARSNFENIEELGGNGWTNFDDVRLFSPPAGDTDPAYDFFRISANHNKVCLATGC